MASEIAVVCASARYVRDQAEISLITVVINVKLVL